MVFGMQLYYWLLAALWWKKKTPMALPFESDSALSYGTKLAVIQFWADRRRITFYGIKCWNPNTDYHGCTEDDNNVNIIWNKAGWKLLASNVPKNLYLSGGPLKNKQKSLPNYCL
ncbi:hypothetical protein FQR65_LT08045 [Abscondita terminalis]|nr:hypothetical protein FQR65_LT08045 [Abscondita terminalis]